MRVSRHQISKVFASQTFKNGLTKHQSRELAAYLLSEGRTSEVSSILRDVDELWAEKGIVNITAVSAHELSEAVLADVKRIARSIYPNAKQVIISKKIDSELIGGGRIELPNSQIDLSVRSRLDNFKQLVGAGKE